MVNNASQKYLDSINGTRSIEKAGKFRLDIAEGLFELPQRFTNQLHAIELSDISSLPDRTSTSLKTAISKFISLTPDNVSVFSGSDEIIEIIPRIYLNQSDVSLCVVPTFSRMIASPKKVGCEVKLFSLSKDHGFKLDEESFQDLVKLIKSNRPKTVWICTPNNPTGVNVELSKIERLVKEFPESLFIINEVYQEYFSLDFQDSSASLVNENANLLVIRSFSKAFGLAGMRVGYVVGSKDRIYEIEKLRTMYNLSTVSQKLAIEALSDTNYLSEMVKFTKTERDRVLKALSSDCNDIEFVPESNSNLLLIKHKFKDLFQELYDKNVLASDWRNADGIKDEGFVRISIGQKDQNDKVISLLKEIN